jgi:diadenosine tetraphosphatase ApaH/serine/threonine PP2A family protein phosphatase
LSGESLERFDRALDAVLAVLAQRPDIIGILFFGSAARGEATTGSDLDLYAITREDMSGSIGCVAGGVPAEISFASLTQWSSRIREERPTVVHAFATGRPLLDRTEGGFAALCQEARVLWERGPRSLSDAEILRFRFHLTDLVRDLEAMPENSAATALMASAGTRLALEAQCAIDRVWLPSLRNTLTTLQPLWPDLMALIERSATAGFPRSLARQVAKVVLQHLGGELETYDTTNTSRS